MNLVEDFAEFLKHFEIFMIEYGHSFDETIDIAVEEFKKWKTE